MTLRAPTKADLPCSYKPIGNPQDNKYRRRLHLRNAALVWDHDGVIMSFDRLPTESRMALIQYKAVDGEAWALSPMLLRVLKETAGDNIPEKVWVGKLRRTVPYYTKHHGAELFGYIAALPTSALTAVVMDDAALVDRFDDFQHYHDWYMSIIGKHQAVDRRPWPVMLSNFPDETLQDGWTRFHQYVEQGQQTLPAIWFPGA